MLENSMGRTASIALLLMGVGCAAGNGASPVTQPQTASDALTHPAANASRHFLLGDGDDPSMTYFQGKYYLVQANFAQQVTVLRSSQLATVMSDETFTYTDTADPNLFSEAPDIDVVTDPRDGTEKLAIYITKTYPLPGTVKVLLTADPAQGFEDMGFLSNVAGYDPHFMVHPNGNQYMYFADFNQLKIIAMSNPWTTRGEAATIAVATLPWETQENSALNEAPAHVISGNTLNLVYSANVYDHSDYLCGLLTIPLGSDPMDPSQWQKYAAAPVFSTAHGNLGPGSGTFFNDGNTTWWGYKSFTDPNNFNPQVHAQAVTFDPNGRVQLGSPL